MMHRSSLALIKKSSKNQSYFRKNEIETITFFQQSGDIFPEKNCQKMLERRTKTNKDTDN
jgi:hypothetical protein